MKIDDSLREVAYQMAMTTLRDIAKSERDNYEKEQKQHLETKQEIRALVQVIKYLSFRIVKHQSNQVLFDWINSAEEYDIAPKLKTVMRRAIKHSAKDKWREFDDYN